jgi:hypothetical protein
MPRINSTSIKPALNTFYQANWQSTRLMLYHNNNPVAWLQDARGVPGQDLDQQACMHDTHAGG